MKRTPLERKTPIKAKAGLKPGGTLKRTASKKAPPTKRKDGRWRSEAYLSWVRTLPCCSCRGPGGDAHHLIGVGQLGGMGTKAPDSYVMPLCRLCHQAIHNSPEDWPTQWEWVARTVALAIHEGLLKRVTG